MTLIKIFPDNPYATNGVFYLSIDPSEAMKCVAFHNHLGEDQISQDYFIFLDQRYNKYLSSVCSEVYYCTSITVENEKVQTCENQLLTFVKSIVKEHYQNR